MTSARALHVRFVKKQIKSNFEALARRLGKQSTNGTCIKATFTYIETVLNSKFNLNGSIVIVRNTF